jgi:hypothetical protein
MYYSSDFRKEQQASRFDRWRVNYDLLLRIIEAKEAYLANKSDKDSSKAVKTISSRT